MAKYREHFRLSINDLNVIEQAIRVEMSIHARIEPRHADFDIARKKTRELNEVLGKLFNQKVFYSQVNETGVPAA
jgi:hypothetical protein